MQSQNAGTACSSRDAYSILRTASQARGFLRVGVVVPGQEPRIGRIAPRSVVERHAQVRAVHEVAVLQQERVRGAAHRGRRHVGRA